jgi:hypothetical protein
MTERKATASANANTGVSTALRSGRDDGFGGSFGWGEANWAVGASNGYLYQAANLIQTGDAGE